MSQTQAEDHQLLVALEGQPCHYCDDGTLAPDVYKGNDAVVCQSCDVPHAQLW